MILDGLRGMFETKPPDGWFDGDLCWFDTALTPATILARGARVDLPDLKSATDAAREDYYEGLGSFFCQVGAEEAVKFQWRVDADYHAELEAYRERGREATGWCAAVRAERYQRYVEAMKAGRLRRERLDMYVAKRCVAVPKGGFRTAEQTDRYVEQSAKNFADRFRNLAGRLPGSTFTPFDDLGHFMSWREFCQPGWRAVGENRSRGFDPHGTILENCWPGGGVTTRDVDGHVFFRMDGYYHVLVVIRRWPMTTHMGLVWALTGALAGNYCYTLNCYPLDATREVKRIEDEIRRVKGARVHEDKDSLDDVLRRKKGTISALSGGFARPYSVLPVIRVWGLTMEGVMAQVQALKEAISAMNGAQCMMVDEPVSAKCLFYETLPGWTGGRYREWDLFALAGRDPTVCFLQDLLPLSASYTGHLNEAEALYDGYEGNLVGVRMFANGTPQHSVAIGTTRVGKSSQIIDHISQTDCLYGFRGIVEEGLSYGTVVQLLDGQTIVLHPDGELTINYLDTQGLPLTRLQVASAAGQLLVMSGRATDPEVNTQRKTMLGEYIEAMYSDAWSDFRGVHPEKEIEAARWAVLVARARRQEAAYQNLSLLEIFADMREHQAEAPDEFAAALASVTEDEAVGWARRPETAQQVRDLGLAFLPSASFPTHTALVERLKYHRMAHHEKEAINRLASRLAAWQRNGSHGKLFDGVSNCDLSNRLVHFELGLLPQSNVEMKEAAVHLIANRLRQRIVTMPRGIWKQFILEEPSRYLAVGGMEELLAEFYAQMGKFGCHILPATQQYGQLAKSALRPVIFGNSKQFFLFKQNDRHDLDDIGGAIGLPESARAAIRGFTAPEYQNGDAKFSEMAVFTQEGERTECGVVRNFVTPEMLYVSNSSGPEYDARTKALQEYDDPLEGVMAETAKAQAMKLKRKKKGWKDYANTTVA